ncbi:MAG TPA: DUF3891 family protein [Rubrobacteraceae bacterium]|nr:DUF3891 family protein [Rubrobacteraceae bacterium]
MIVRERQDSFLLFGQHEHALASGEFARWWNADIKARDATLFAIANHDLAWRPLDRDILWDEERDRPYSFVDYPVEEKLRAYTAGLDELEGLNFYAACLCSMHYETLARRFGKSAADARFAEDETRRQEGLRRGMSEEERDSLERNLRLLKLCDGLSLFVCLNEPGALDRPPPYPGGFELWGGRYEPVWEDERTLRLEPNSFTGTFEIGLPYREVGRDRRLLESNVLKVRVTC